MLKGHVPGLRKINEGRICAKRRIFSAPAKSSIEQPSNCSTPSTKVSLSKRRLRMATINDLIDKFTAFTAELKTRNEIDKELMKENLGREKSSTNERRFLILIIVVLAGVDLGKTMGLI